MENETNVSVAIIEPYKSLFGITRAMKKQAAKAAKENPHLIILPIFTKELRRLDKVYEIAKKINPHVVMFSRAEGAQKYNTYDTNNPLANPKPVYTVWCAPDKEEYIGSWGLDLLVLFGGDKINPEANAFNAVKPEGYLIWIDNHGNHEVFHKRLEGKGTYNFRALENLEKKTKNCSWYDLKFA
jgi:hypothetical protein